MKRYRQVIAALGIVTIMGSMTACGSKSTESSATQNSASQHTTAQNTSEQTTAQNASGQTTAQNASGQTTAQNASGQTTTQNTSDQTTQSAAGQQGTQAAQAAATVAQSGTTGTTSKGYTIQEIDGVTYVDGVLIANKTYSLPETYGPGDITAEVKSAFNVMQQAAAAQGLNLYISSGFRSYSRQNTIYNNYVKADGQAAADTYSARPGNSEHQTGLCFDLNTIDDSFANTPESAWLEKHAQEYGFIIRYGKGKEGVTGYQYEPWHLRYLGVDLATKVYNTGLSLEEYYGITSVYPN